MFTRFVAYVLKLVDAEYIWSHIDSSLHDNDQSFYISAIIVKFFNLKVFDYQVGDILVFPVIKMLSSLTGYVKV